MSECATGDYKLKLAATLLAVSMLSVGSAAVAAPITLAFNARNEPSTIVQSGYSISVNFGGFNSDNSIDLYANDRGATSTLSRVDGGTFDFLSIVLHQYDPKLDVTFTGQLAGGGVVTAEYTGTGGVGSSVTAVLPADFADLVSVSFVQGVGTVNSYYYNQLTVQSDSQVPSVPEPATWAVFLVGCGAVGLVLRHSRPA